MIRLVLIILTLIAYYIIGIIILPLFWLVGKKDKHKGDYLTFRAVQTAFRAGLFISGTKATFVGLENIPKDVPVMYIGNHRSFFDVLLTYIKCEDLTGFIAKKEIKKVPILPIWMRRVHCLFLDRHDMRAGMKVILEAIDKVKNGISVIVFPEGTRNKDAKKEQELLPFKDGTFKIAAKTGCAVVPVALTGTIDIFESHFPRVKPAKVVVRYGKPVYIKDLDEEDAKHPGEYFRNVLIGMLDENDKLI